MSGTSLRRIRTRGPDIVSTTSANPSIRTNRRPVKATGSTSCQAILNSVKVAAHIRTTARRAASTISDPRRSDSMASTLPVITWRTGPGGRNVKPSGPGGRTVSGGIEVHGLRKEYRRLRGGATVAGDRLDLSVPEGGVFGFLGPNGAGKTTTIRCLLGLVRPTGGACRLMGVDSQRDLHSVIGRVGSIVETPALFPRFSGRRNLRLLARLDGIGRKRADEALERVGLAPRANHPVKTYSLGMKQRLGIAAALLKDPALLILDEPANGLDPAGIKEVRELLRALGAEGRTVFVSS